MAAIAEKVTIETKTVLEDVAKKTMIEKAHVAELTESELVVVTKVFRSFETGLREGTILPKVRLFST